jgi:ribosomal protein S18 acetylase RimI-like enzyme
MPEAIDVRRGGAADLPALEPLWVAIHRAHAACMPELAPYVSDAQTWAVRSALYAELLAKADTVLLLARDGDALVGYGLAHVLPAEQTWVEDTWVVGERVGEIESLGVLPSHRGRGIGSVLLDALEAALREDGVHDLVLGVLPGNTAARRLYERRGYRPAWLYLSRWTGRDGAPRG